MFFTMMMHQFMIGKVGRRHPCNNGCDRMLEKGQERIEDNMNRYCLVCGHKKIKEMIKMLQSNLKEIEKTHLKEIIAMRMVG